MASGRDGIVIRLQSRTLNLQTTRVLAPDVTDTELARRPTVIDARAVEFVESFGLVYLYWFIRRLLSAGADEVDVFLDDSNTELCNYLKRMELAEAFGSAPVCIPALEGLHLRRRALATVVVELCVFGLENDNEVEQKASELQYVIVNQRPDLAVHAENLHGILSEVLSNIEVHSETREASVAVQTYSDRIELAFGDGGRGFQAALRPILDGDFTDVNVIEEAVRMGVSSRPTRGGTGLWELCEIVRESGGQLAIRSGSGQLIIRRTSRSRFNDCNPLPGALVAMTLPI